MFDWTRYDFMSTRSGRSYRAMEDTTAPTGRGEMPSGDATGGWEEPASLSGGTDQLSSIIQVLMEERRLRETQISEERERREREFERQQLQREAEMQEKFEMVMRVLEHTAGKSKSPVSSGELTVKVAKLTDDNDIEGYVTTFERQMVVYEVDQTRWAYLLAPKLLGKAQQAYLAVDSEAVGDYDAIKKKILKQYGINEEAYRRKFRAR